MSQGERRMSEGERLVARAHAHPRSIGPEMDSLLYAILGSLLRNCLAQLSTLVLVLRASGRPTQILVQALRTAFADATRDQRLRVQ
jgi:hypothetical protein